MMDTGRMEAFSDGVFAIIITIMVLGVEGAAWRRACRTVAAPAGVPKLRVEFRLSGHLLEQSPSHAAGYAQSKRPNLVGQFAPSVLAIAYPLRHRLDGREQLCAGTDGPLRGDFVHC